MSTETIFTVTTIRSPGKSRTVGWFPNLEMAKQSVLNNTGDIYEGCYIYCVIVEVGPGIYPFPPKSETWYRWDKEEYGEIEKPIEHIRNNFGIG